MKSERVFQEMILRLTKGTRGLNQLGTWKEGRGDNGIPDRHHSICEDRTMGESIAIWIMQLVECNTGSRVWTLAVECLRLHANSTILVAV